MEFDTYALRGVASQQQNRLSHSGLSHLADVICKK